MSSIKGFYEHPSLILSQIGKVFSGFENLWQFIPLFIE